ncbi:MAG: hypothetical protein MJ224_04600 [archaeon]|nr:hypothetical protein [archaeon]
MLIKDNEKRIIKNIFKMTLNICQNQFKKNLKKLEKTGKKLEKLRKIGEKIDKNKAKKVKKQGKR